MRRVEKLAHPPKAAVLEVADRSAPDAEPPMRRLSWIAVEKEELERAIADGTAAVRRLFDSLTGRNSDVVNSALVAEQRQLCVYCEVQLRPDKAGRWDVRRAHWKPLSTHPEFALHWRNLYASCARKSTCDSAQGDHDLLLPWPSTFEPSDFLRCSDAGRLTLSDQASRLAADEAEGWARALLPEKWKDADLDALLTPLSVEVRAAVRTRLLSLRHITLNLNDPVLLRAREAAIDEAKTRLGEWARGRTLSQEQREAYVRARVLGGALPPFATFIVKRLLKQRG